jgi:Xaa-Pro dipeptidase
MRRREFLQVAGAAGAGALAGAGRRGRSVSAGPATQHEVDPLPAETFQRRLDAARASMAERGLDVVFAEPSTNFMYLTSASFGRSERLIALVLQAEGDAAIVAPGFEVGRVEAAVKGITDIRGWEEDEDPYKLIADLVWKGEPGRMGIEPSVRYGVVSRLRAALPQWELVDAEPLFTDLRITKTDEELRLIRRAISITEAAIAATFAELDVGLTDREVADHLSQRMSEGGASGGGLVQFGPTSAIPHGGTENRRLERGMPVLIDAGCRVYGYTSDITRMHFFGDDPSPRYREVFDVVLAAQTAAFEAGRAGVECQELDAIARRLITEAGYGEHFTHRLGHGMGMDGHEPPYLVSGNDRKLEPGMVFTIEPGIYLSGEWGVRIEDDFVVREDRLEPLSSRVSPI